MLNWVASLPLWLATTFLFVIVFFRAQCTFWLGKLSYHGILKTKWGKKLEKNSETSSGIIAIQRIGWPIIPLSFLTVGFQTAVQFGAGLTNWSWFRYTLAALPGYLAWGFIYAIGGLQPFSLTCSRLGWLTYTICYHYFSGSDCSESCPSIYS